MKRKHPFLAYWKKKVKSLYGKYPVKFRPLTAETKSQAIGFVQQSLTD
jgi:hypothetical protein